jgi:hypothetical protein
MNRGEFIFQAVMAAIALAVLVLFAGESLGFWNVIPARTDPLYDRG